MLTRGATALLATSACLPGAMALGASGMGRRLLQECSQPQAVGANAFSYQLNATALSTLPATAGALASGSAWGMFEVNGCHQRLGAAPGPLNLTYTFDPPQGNDGRSDISNVRAVDGTQRAFVSQTLSQLSNNLDIHFVQVTGSASDQANLQVVQADATPAKVPASTYSLGPGDGSEGQTTAQLVVVGDTLVDTLQGVGGALGLTAFNSGAVTNATLTDDSDGWLSTVMGLKSTPCFTPGTYGASDWSALQAAYGLAPAIANGTTFALGNGTSSGGILGAASNNTLSATFDGPVVLNLGNAPGNVSHIGDARLAWAPTTEIIRGDISGTQGGYLLGNGIPNTLIGGAGNTVIDPIGGANNTVVAGGAQNIVVVGDRPSLLTVYDFKLSQDKLGLQFSTPLSGVKVADTSARDGHVQLAFPNGQNVTLANITAHAYAGLPTLNQILLQNFTYTLPQDCQTVPAHAPAPSIPALPPTPIVPPPAPALAPTPGLAPSPPPGMGPAPAPAPSHSPPPPPSPSPTPPSPSSTPPSPTDPGTPSAHHSGSHVGVAVGVGVGVGVPVVVVGAGVIGAAVLAGRRRRSQRRNPDPAPIPPGPQRPPYQPQADDGPYYDVEMSGR